ncbi:NAD(P)/FAD-dependent oxidoreductase [filamentous cyanobacterium LEGE 11480]|uniref:demethylphylloquinone reductase n=1 Tax=Romeriopsis navalis LEGE 11480 TaxID=2777977 RepID=A0A928Z4Y5_9CYAN|nr:NAD(P)/FAD-dependent oxidoreductase [Romeriopsis navalis]MBE9033106.1 NAD(P)/FAD-dependent oxidoreductase [Romeriopsis navalis LEGE 11480]
MPTTQPAKICILGGGFGGLYTALRLSQMTWTHKPEITLVDQRDRFVFAPLLYELLTGELESWEIAPEYTTLLANTGIIFKQQQVAGIDLPTKTVQFDDATTQTYDRLVLAMGGETPMDIVDGAAEYAIPFRDVADAMRVSERLRQLEASDAEKIRVAIVGGGYSGVELACKLAERLGERGRVRIVERSDQILGNSPEFNRETAEKALSQRSVWRDLETTVTNITADTITLKYQESENPIPVDLVLWTIGNRIVPVIQDLPIAHNDRGQIVVTSAMQVEANPEIFALGDLAECRDETGQLVPATAQGAFQQADYAGWNVWASLTERPLLPFRYQALGEMMTLGMEDATLSGLGLHLNGLPAHVARRMIYLFRMPTLEHQVKVGINWMTKPLVKFLQQVS